MTHLNLNFVFFAVVILLLCLLFVWRHSKRLSERFEEKRKSEERFQMVARATEDAIWEWDLLTNHVWYSEIFFTLFGYNPETTNPTIDFWKEHVHPEDVGWVLSEVESALRENKRVWGGEYRFRHADGTYRHIYDRGYVIQDEQGKPIRMVGAMMDVTKRKQVEEAKLRLAAIVESSDDAIISKDLSGKILTWNRGAEHIYGYTAQEVIGKPISILSVPDQPDETKKILDSIAKGEMIEHYETKRKHKEGHLLDISITVSPLRNMAGEVIGAAVLARDISKRKHLERELQKHQVALELLVEQRTEELSKRNLELEKKGKVMQSLLEDLQESKERVQSVIATSMDAFVAIDNEGKIIDWNIQAERIFGWPKSEVLGKTLTETIIPPKYREAHIRGFQHFLKTGEGPVLNKRLEMSAMRSSGEEFPIEMTIWPLKTGSGYVFNAFLHDITERKQLEHMKDNFISTVSHELRAPLSIVKGVIEALRDGIVGKMTPKQNHMVSIGDRSVDRLSRLITDLLDLSRLESGKIKIARKPLEIRSLMKEMLEDFKISAKEKKIALQEEEEKSLPQVEADPDLLIQVLTNLMNNAMRFAKTKVTLRATKGEAGGIEVSVIDDGPGISSEDQKKLFNKFEQIERVKEDNGYAGTGLGLAICKEILKQHGGKIWVKSKPGRGSEFHVLLPKEARSR